MSFSFEPTTADDNHHEAEHDAGRRIFMKGATAASIGVLAGAAGLPAVSLGAAGTKTLVKVIMPGGADSLSLLPMVGDDAYYTVRPTVAIAKPSSSNAASAISLGANTPYGLNPNLAGLKEIWDSGRMAISPATHFAEGNRSHFDCQKWVGFGSSDASIRNGVFTRYLAQASKSTHLMRGLNAGMGFSHFMVEANVPAVSDPARYTRPFNPFIFSTTSSPNWSTAETFVRTNIKVAYDTVDLVAGYTSYQPSANAGSYSSTPLGKGLSLIAFLLKKGMPVEVACVNWAGYWDTHQDLVGAAHIGSLKTGASDLLTFWKDIEAMRDNVVVMVGSEFGRTVRENGSRGSDHGLGGAWLAFGGPTRGGIYGAVPNLGTVAGSNYLPVLINYKDMLGEALVKHLGMSSSLLSAIFPNYTFKDNKMFSA